MAHSAIVTAKTGPDKTNTAIVLNDVLRADFQLADRRLQFHLVNQAGNQVKEYDLTGVTTLTCTITAGQFAFVVS